MTLIPGCRLTVASKFHMEPNWSERIAVGTGVEHTGGGFFPLGPWQAPTADDLAALLTPVTRLDTLPRSLPLVGELEPPLPSDGSAEPDSLALFQIPDHLRTAWWDLLDETAASGGPMRGFDEFAVRMREFLAFKRLEILPDAAMEVTVTAVGERSIRRDPDTGGPTGLCPSVASAAPWPPVERVATPRLWGIVNLGDEPTSVVLVNLSLSNMAAELARRMPADPVPATVGQLVGRFLLACPDYPPVRLQLGSGEGFRFPTAGLVFDGDPTGKQEPDVLLIISTEGG